MRRSRLELLKNGLMALPVFTTLAGAFFGYLEGHESGHNILATIKGTVPDPLVEAEPLPWYEVLKNAAICSAMGLTGGIAVTCFGMVATHNISVEPDPLDRQARRTDSGEFVASNIKTYFKKSDVEDHLKSTIRTTEKYDKKKQEQKAEATQILEIGTEGIRAKKLGKTISSKKTGGK